MTQELRDFWDAFDKHRLQIRMQLGGAMGDASHGPAVLELLLPNPTDEQGVGYARLQQRAWLEDQWDGLDAAVAQRVRGLVDDGLRWADWLALLRPVRGALNERVLNAYVTDPARGRAALLGFAQVIDHLTGFVGEALVEAADPPTVEVPVGESADVPVDEPAAVQPSKPAAPQEPSAPTVPQTTVEETVRLILDAAPVPLLAVAQDGDIVAANRQVETLLGYGRGELDGRSVDALVPVSQRSKHSGHRAGYAAMPTARPMAPDTHVKAVHRSGTEIAVELGLTPFVTDGQRLVLTTMFEVTDQQDVAAQLRRTQDDLRQREEEVEQFAAVVSHDLQEPLRMVASYTELLRKQYGEQLDERADLYIGKTVEGAQRLNAVVQDLLVYSRVKSRSGSFVPTETGQLVQGVLSELASQIDEASAEVETEGRLPTIVADSSQLHLVFKNLVRNALEFRRADVPSRVRVGAERRGEHWLFWVADNGLGIDEQHMSRIFGLFHRVHPEQHEGSGIGLTVCRRIVERHGGKIRVESAIGEGSTFYFTLPLWPVTG